MTTEQRVGDGDGPNYPTQGMAQYLDQARWEEFMARPLSDEVLPIAPHLAVGAEDLEPFDLGPVAPGEALVALAQFDEEPHWQLHIVSPKVNKNLSFKHRTLGRCSTAQLMVTLNTGVFYTEQGQLQEWTPDTYCSVWGNNAIYDYIVRMLMPQHWREDPPIHSHCRIYPVYSYAAETPVNFRIARGNGLVMSFYDTAMQHALESEVHDQFTRMLEGLVDEADDDDPKE